MDRCIDSDSIYRGGTLCAIQTRDSDLANAQRHIAHAKRLGLRECVNEGCEGEGRKEGRKDAAANQQAAEPLPSLFRVFLPLLLLIVAPSRIVFTIIDDGHNSTTTRCDVLRETSNQQGQQERGTKREGMEEQRGNGTTREHQENGAVVRVRK